MKNLSIIALLIALTVPFSSYSQCKGFAKKKCIPILEDYVPTENYNSLQMVEGEEAELYLVFVENNDYRIAVCSHPVLGDVNFIIQTEKGQLIFDSIENEGSNIFDFSTISTEKLHLIISVPAPENPTGMVHPGCVTIMVGNKAS